MLDLAQETGTDDRAAGRAARHETTAVTPLPTRMRQGADETYPFGL